MTSDTDSRRDYSLAELAALSGLAPRTIRYYVAQGLVASPGREGPATRYAESTLARLRLIAKLRDAHLPLAAIRQQLAGLTEDDLRRLSAQGAEPTPPPSAGSALDYIRAVLGEGGTAPTPTPAAALAMPPSAPVLSAKAMPSAIASSPTTPSTQPGERSQWERIAIGPDIELHVRRPLSRRDNRLVERLVAFARQLQGEDRP